MVLLCRDCPDALGQTLMGELELFVCVWDCAECMPKAGPLLFTFCALTFAAGSYFLSITLTPYVVYVEYLQALCCVEVSYNT